MNPSPLRQRAVRFTRRIPEWARHWLARLRSRWKRTTGEAIDLLFPPACQLCERLLPISSGTPQSQEKILFCERCRQALRYRTPRVCRRCAAPLAPASQRPQCPECARRKLPFAGGVALGEYRGKLREAVLRTKKSAHESLTMQLGELLAEHVSRADWGPRIQRVVPLPSHWWRRWMRGTSGPELLAEAVARQLQCPCDRRLLRCRRRTRKQGTLRPQERQRNVQDAFSVALDAKIQGESILLIDDVMTTGATLREAARVLRAAGARAVFVAVLARGTGAPAP